MDEKTQEQKETQPSADCSDGTDARRPESVEGKNGEATIETKAEPQSAKVDYDEGEKKAQEEESA